jgi:hypothetical protein
LLFGYTSAAIVPRGASCCPVPAVPVVARRGLELVQCLGQGVGSVLLPNVVLVA